MFFFPTLIAHRRCVKTNKRSVFFRQSSTLSQSRFHFESKYEASFEYAKYYDYNCASEAEMASAFGAGIWFNHTLPLIRAAIINCYEAIATSLPFSSKYYPFLWCGFDFVIDEFGKPWLLEVNVKPPTRYFDPSFDFDVPLARRLAKVAISSFLEIIARDSAVPSRNIPTNCSSEWESLY